MLITGIIGPDNKCKTANLISSLFSSAGKKSSIIHSSNLISMDLFHLKEHISQFQHNNTGVLIVLMDICDVDEKIFDFLHFDIMIYTDKAGNLKESANMQHPELMRRIFSLMDEKGIVIVNADDSELIRLLQGMKYYIITYGFNSKASITASSTGDAISQKDNFMCCLQRTISTKHGLLVEPQEYSIRISSNEFDAYSILAAASFAIVNDIDLNLVKV